MREVINKNLSALQTRHNFRCAELDFKHPGACLVHETEKTLSRVHVPYTEGAVIGPGNDSRFVKLEGPDELGVAIECF
jgi:hypothetical protein